MKKLIVAFCVFVLPNLAFSAPVALPSAGPENWAVLGLGSTGSAGFTNIVITGPSSVKGTVGVAQSGNFSMSGSSLIEGSLVLNTAGRLNQSGPSMIDSLQQNDKNDSLLNEAVIEAVDASIAAAGMDAPNTSVTHINITNPSQNITIAGEAGINVLNLTDLVITNGTLTLDAPFGGSFVINVAGRFSLSGGSDIELEGGLTPYDVLYNIIGAGEKVSLSGGTSNGVPNTTVRGILLAPEREISISPGLVIGEVIGGGKQIAITSGGQVHNLLPDLGPR